jgi:alanine-glyoxylate transaminase/serine-glyoxylate transaminase/serine-pyruvate transaminase
VRSWYLDVSLIANYWGGDRVYHHTAPINMTYALHEALRIVLEEGLEAAWARHRRNHDALRAGLAALGVGYATQGVRAASQCGEDPEGWTTWWCGALYRFNVEIGAGREHSRARSGGSG